MSRLHRNTITYWLSLAMAVAFSIFAVWVAVLFLSMSIRGRIDGGLSLNVVVTCAMLVWTGMVGAFDMALWTLRTLPADITIFGLGFAQRPREEAAALAWWWIRIAWYAWVSFSGLLLTTALILWLFQPWLSTP